MAVKQFPERCVPCPYRQLDDGAPPCRLTQCPAAKAVKPAKSGGDRR